jgi:spermidine/putrescine transport system permease protein
MLVAAVTIPWLVLGVAMLLVVTAAGIGRGWPALFLGNLVVALPFTVFLVVNALASVNGNLEEAARSLGSSPLSAFLRVVVPAIAPAIIAGAIMAFLTCFNNFTIQYFLAPFGTQTLPMAIYGQIKIGFRPDINALATIITALTLIPVLLAPRLLSKRGGTFSIGV